MVVLAKILVYVVPSSSEKCQEKSDSYLRNICIVKIKTIKSHLRITATICSTADKNQDLPTGDLLEYAKGKCPHAFRGDDTLSIYYNIYIDDTCQLEVAEKSNQIILTISSISSYVTRK